jgi:hypothetical protein
MVMSVLMWSPVTLPVFHVIRMAWMIGPMTSPLGPSSTSYLDDLQ